METKIRRKAVAREIMAMSANAAKTVVAVETPNETAKWESAFYTAKGALAKDKEKAAKRRSFGWNPTVIAVPQYKGHASSYILDLVCTLNRSLDGLRLGNRPYERKLVKANLMSSLAGSMRKTRHLAPIWTQMREAVENLAIMALGIDRDSRRVGIYSVNEPNVTWLFRKDGYETFEFQREYCKLAGVPKAAWPAKRYFDPRVIKATGAILRRNELGVLHDPEFVRQLRLSYPVSIGSAWRAYRDRKDSRAPKPEPTVNWGDWEVEVEALHRWQFFYYHMAGRPDLVPSIEEVGEEVLSFEDFENLNVEDEPEMAWTPKDDAALIADAIKQAVMVEGTERVRPEIEKAGAKWMAAYATAELQNGNSWRWPGGRTRKIGLCGSGYDADFRAVLEKHVAQPVVEDLEDAPVANLKVAIKFLDWRINKAEDEEAYARVEDLVEVRDSYKALLEEVAPWAEAARGLSRAKNEWGFDEDVTQYRFDRGHFELKIDAVQ